MVPLGVQVFDFETESAAPMGTSPQVLAVKAEKRKRREIALSAFCVNWSGAVIPLPSRKLGVCDRVRTLPTESREF
jgi:hypothetical protein